jgi:hypothetical protein
LATKLFHVTVVLFSRHLDGSHEQVEEYVGGVCAELQASEKDKTICKIRKCMEKYKWTKEGELKPYFIVRKDLTVHESIILKGRKLVIPRKLRQRIL